MEWLADDELSADVNGASWFFNGAHVNVSCQTVWRLLVDGKVKRVSSDHEQWFGLPHPLNLVSEMSALLGSHRLNKITVADDTVDLLLSFTDGIVVQCLISSSGYESYTFSIDGDEYVGAGGGVLFHLKPTGPNTSIGVRVPRPGDEG